VRCRRPADQAAAFGPVDQAGDAGLVQAQVPGKLLHGGLAITQHAEQAQLDDRHPAFRGDLPQHALYQEGQLSQAVDDPQVRCLRQRVRRRVVGHVFHST
jgi:hypothetical protein